MCIFGHFLCISFLSFPLSKTNLFLLLTNSPKYFSPCMGFGLTLLVSRGTLQWTLAFITSAAHLFLLCRSTIVLLYQSFFPLFYVSFAVPSQCTPNNCVPQRSCDPGPVSTPPFLTPPSQPDDAKAHNQYGSLSPPPRYGL